MKTTTRRALLVGAGAAVGAGTFAILRERGLPPAALASAEADDGLVLDDASGLSRTPVARHLTLARDPDDAFIEAVRKEIALAHQEGRTIAASTARHSMGGQSLPRGGTALTLDQGFVEADVASSTFRAGAGTRWSTVIETLDRQGFSPAVMQSNNDFGVAATFCVNAHGWPAPFGPFGSTVRSFRMVMADGSLVTCSREQNRDLFELSMGGYGLAGIIVDMIADMVPNMMLEPHYEMLGAEAFGDTFQKAAEGDPDLQMAYGRVDVSRDGFFKRALMATYRPDGSEGPLPPARGSGFVSHASREVYRAQPGSERMKKLRWWMETRVGPAVAGRATRNTLMNEPVATLAGRDALLTDILHEYFVPPDRFADFALACQEVIPASYQELLNVTLRYVGRDRESVLSYAPAGPRIAAVMSFTQEKSQRAENDMTAMTRALIERVLDIGGTYYLPYRLHASDGQALRAYPRLAEFARRKREADPEGRFSNALWERYMKELDA